jgi:DNA-binding transcriptional regulator YiaG
MANIAAMLKEEFRRTARRSARSLFQPVKKDVSELKRSVATLRREVERLTGENARLLNDLKERIEAGPNVPEEQVEKSRMSPRNILGQRERLGLCREDFAKLLGVSSKTIASWEGGKTRPVDEARAAIISVRKLGRREARFRLGLLK